MHRNTPNPELLSAEEYTRLPNGKLPAHLGYSVTHVLTNWFMMNQTKSLVRNIDPPLGEPNVEEFRFRRPSEILVGSVPGLGSFSFEHGSDRLCRYAPGAKEHASKAGNEVERLTWEAAESGQLRIERRFEGNDRVEVLHERTGKPLYGNIIQSAMLNSKPVHMTAFQKCGMMAAAENYGYKVDAESQQMITNRAPSPSPSITLPPPPSHEFHPLGNEALTSQSLIGS